MSGGILRFPWTSQPQTPTPIDRANPLSKNLSLAFIGGQSRIFNPATNGRNTVTGSKIQTTQGGQVSGFNTTYGTGTTDRIDTSLTADSEKRSWFARVYVSSWASSRIFDIGNNACAIGGGGTSLIVSCVYSGGQTTLYTPSTAPPTNAWFDLLITWDRSGTNIPIVYTDGVEVSISNGGTLPSGTYTTQTTALLIGNRLDNVRSLPGMVECAYVWDRILSPAEAVALTRNRYQLYQPIQRTIWVPAAGGGVSGTLATTNANDTSAASGTTTVTGTLAKTNANDSSSASGTTTVTGTLATTNANDTSAASGSPVVVGTLATTNANDSVVASGDVGGNITGTVNYTNANDTGAASGTTTVTGSLATTNANDSASASGTTTVTGTSAYTNANDTVAASGAAGTVTGTVNVTNDNDTSAASGTAGNPVIASQGGGGWMPPQGRRKTRKEVYAERVKLGILPPAIVRAAEKVAVVAETVQEFKAERPRYEEMFMRELNVTKWSPSYTRAIQIQIELMQQDDEDILLLMM